MIKALKWFWKHAERILIASISVCFLTGVTPYVLIAIFVVVTIAKAIGEE